MFLFCILLCFTWSNCSAAAVAEVAWHSPPNERGRWDLIVSCVLSLFLCVSSALHLNVSTQESKHKATTMGFTRHFRARSRRKYRVCVVLDRSMVDERDPRGYCIPREADKAVSKKQSKEWTMAQCFLAVMGGIVIKLGNYVGNSDHRTTHKQVETLAIPTNSRLLSITAERARLISFLTRLPAIQDNQVRDKGKADGLAKFLVVVQAEWMVIQSIARLQQELPVTLLEINIIGHVICASALYLLWWNTPLDIKASMSPISGNKADETSEIHCLAYKTPAERIENTAATPTTHFKDDNATAVEISLSNKGRTRLSNNFFFTHSSIGLFIGEPIYAGDHIPKFPSFSFLGSVNVQRVILRTDVAFAGAIYSGLHLAAWNDYFPTTVERIMWIVCLCATGLTGLVLASFFRATNQLPQLEAGESHVRHSRKVQNALKGMLIPLFMTARAFIVAEDYVCLRSQLAAIYRTPEWSNYLPHL
ncbi:hypothetical protein SVAN01_05671 [Stagonosporopsis vannaccii]|nr:hypothetical protein SVAN01_05671 [Stagonosporopsis vannaccii]